MNFVVRGAFTRAGADEAAAGFDGCEPHSANWGGTMLFERASASSPWKQVKYVSGFHPSSCIAVRGGDGRDLLVCDRTDGHQTVGENYLLAFDFADADAERSPLALLLSNDNCPAAAGDDNQKLVRSSLLGYEMAVREGKPVLVARIAFAVVPQDKPFRDACANGIRTDNRVLQEAARKLLPPPTEQELVFTFDGQRFTVAPESAALYKQVTTALDP
jgi:hypothetical protein